MNDHERESLATQLRDAWENELTQAGFCLRDAPTVGIAGRYRWELRGFADHHFYEEKSPMALLHACEQRLDHAGLGGVQRTSYRVGRLREFSQRLARLQSVEWRIEIDQRIEHLSMHPFDREERRAALWHQVTARGLPPRLDD